jgi:site-specific DNA-methyltransferase (adenine-specific)
MIKANLIFGDCREKLKELADNSIDLIFTSPPYADSRNDTYGGIRPDEYVEWFLPITNELHLILKPDDTIILKY